MVTGWPLPNSRQRGFGIIIMAVTGFVNGVSLVAKVSVAGLERARNMQRKFIKYPIFLALLLCLLRDEWNFGGATLWK